MADIWSYREDVEVVDITGFDVEAEDGSIGKIDEVSAEAGENWIVVDTGPWIFGRKSLLPAGTIERIDEEAEKVYVDRTKDEIKNAPAYDEEAYSSDYRTTVGDYYHGYYVP